jgi:hypothetical protein
LTVWQGGGIWYNKEELNSKYSRGDRKMRNTLVIGIIWILLSCIGLAKAEPITIQNTGNVTSTSESGNGLPDTIYTGVTFTGTYTYESSTINGVNGHHIYNSPYGISLSMGGYEFKTAPNHVGQFDMWIINDSSVNLPVTDYYIVRSEYQNISVPSLGFNISSVRWDLRDYDHTALFSDTLPVTAPILTDWEYNDLEIYGYDGINNGLIVHGTVTHAVLIPEPVTGILMAMGVLFLRRQR